MSEESLDNYLANARLILSNFESTLGWEPPVLTSTASTDYVECPFDKGHSIPTGRLRQHVESCKWRKLGYSKEKIEDILDQERRTKAQNDPAIMCYDNIISQIAPSVGLIRSDERFKAELSPEQRLAVYEAEVSKLYCPDKPSLDKALYADLEAKAAEKLYEKENPDNLSEVELMEKVRDLKRRRQSYRAKNVHITKRSQTEIIRGVLEVHMEELKKVWALGKPQKNLQEVDNGKTKGLNFKEKANKSGNHDERESLHQYKSGNSKPRSSSDRAGKDYSQKRLYQNLSRTEHRNTNDRETNKSASHAQDVDDRLPFCEKELGTMTYKDFARQYKDRSKPKIAAYRDDDERHTRKKKLKKHRSKH